MSKVGGNLYFLVLLLEFQLFSLQVTQPTAIVGGKQGRVVGNRPGGNAQRLDMGYIPEAVDGHSQRRPVHERVTTGQYYLFDPRTTLDVKYGKGNMLLCRRLLVPALFMFTKAKPAVNRAAHI